LKHVGLLAFGIWAAAVPPVAAADPPPRQAEGWLSEARTGEDRSLLGDLLHGGPRVRARALDSWRSLRRLHEVREAERVRREAGLPSEDGIDARSTGDAPSVPDFPDREAGIARALARALREAPDATRIAAARAAADLPVPVERELVLSLAHPRASVRAAAAEALASIATLMGVGEPETWPALVESLEDESAAVRLVAIRGVVLYKPPGFAPDASGKRVLDRLVALTGDPASAIRRTATWALGDLTSIEIYPPLAEALLGRLDDPDADVRESAVGVLAATRRSRPIDRGHGRRALVDAVRGLAEEDPSKRVRWTAAHAHWRLTRNPERLLSTLPEQVREACGADLRRALVAVANADPGGALGVEVLRALSAEPGDRFAGLEVVVAAALFSTAPAAKDAMPHVDALLRSPDVGRRWMGAKALRALRDSRRAEIDAARAAHARESAPVVRALLLDAIVDLSSESADVLDVALAALERPEPERGAAVHALATLGPKASAAEGALARVFRRDPHDHDIARALIRVAGPGAALRAAMASPTGTLPGVVANSLTAECCDDAAIEWLASGLERSPREFSRALRRVGARGRSALPRLASLASASEPAVRVEAAAALARVGGDVRRSLDVLVEVLEGGEEEDVASAARALAELGHAEVDVLAALERAVDRQKRTARAAAAYALVRLTEESEPWLGVLRDVVTRSFCPPEEIVSDIGSLGARAVGAVGTLEDVAWRWYEHGHEDPRFVGLTRRSIESLGEIGRFARGALPSLRLLQTNALFRREARRAIASIDGV
jgi:HEAT repeat protein